MLTVNTKKETQEQLKERCRNVGLNNVELFIGTKSEGMTVKEISKSIIQNHAKMWEIGIKTGRDILILEDDVEFLDMHAAWHIEQSLEYCNAHLPNWEILFPGHVPCGPLLPPFASVPGGSLICRTTLPFGAHSYILKNRVARKLIGFLQFDRPFVVEGWITLREKYAMVPAITSQLKWPKEVASRIPGIPPDLLTPAIESCHVAWVVVYVLFIIKSLLIL